MVNLHRKGARGGHISAEGYNFVLVLDRFASFKCDRPSSPEPINGLARGGKPRFGLLQHSDQIDIELSPNLTVQSCDRARERSNAAVLECVVHESGAQFQGDCFGKIESLRKK